MKTQNHSLFNALYAFVLLLFASTLIYVSCEVESNEERIQQLEQTLDAVRAYGDSTETVTDSLSIGVETEWRGVDEYSID